ncbi:hypothetical protein EC609_19020 [Achromobacter denitrificans]|nr:hypothetical protein EC609_19020 [Achromobacter denitrificans]
MKDNVEFRALFSLPPISPSASTAISVPEMPPQQAVTGDREVDAVLWLQQVIKTGNQNLIDKAMEAAKRITTPMEELGERYGAHMARATGSAMGGAFASLGFGDLQNQARRAVEEAARRHEALARFGSAEQTAAETPAEKACKKALRGLKRDKEWGDYDASEVRERFASRPELSPSTIDDCLYARRFWSALYWLRSAATDYGDASPAGNAHDDFCHSMLAHLRPRNAEEALAAFDYLDADGGTDWERAQPIIRNLITSGWQTQTT